MKGKAWQWKCDVTDPIASAAKNTFFFLKLFFIDDFGISHAPQSHSPPRLPMSVPPLVDFPSGKEVHFVLSTYSLEHGQNPSGQPSKGRMSLSPLAEFINGGGPCHDQSLPSGAHATTCTTLLWAGEG